LIFSAPAWAAANISSTLELAWAMLPGDEKPLEYTLQLAFEFKL
jgi:hypothetical protein